LTTITRHTGLDLRRRRLLEVATRLGEQNLGPDRAVEFGKRNAVAGELLVTVHAVKVIGAKDLTG
jgi:hypothetical protein